MEKAKQVAETLIKAGVLKDTELLETVDKACNSDEMVQIQVMMILGSKQLEIFGDRGLARLFLSLMESYLIEKDIWFDNVSQLDDVCLLACWGDNELIIRPAQIDHELGTVKRHVYIQLRNIKDPDSKMEFLMPAIPKMLANYIGG